MTVATATASREGNHLQGLRQTSRWVCRGAAGSGGHALQQLPQLRVRCVRRHCTTEAGGMLNTFLMQFSKDARVRCGSSKSDRLDRNAAHERSVTLYVLLPRLWLCRLCCVWCRRRRRLAQHCLCRLNEHGAGWMIAPTSG